MRSACPVAPISTKRRWASRSSRSRVASSPRRRASSAEISWTIGSLQRASVSSISRGRFREGALHLGCGARALRSEQGSRARQQRVHLEEAGAALPRVGQGLVGQLQCGAGIALTELRLCQEAKVPTPLVRNRHRALEQAPARAARLPRPRSTPDWPGERSRGPLAPGAEEWVLRPPRRARARGLHDVKSSPTRRRRDTRAPRATPATR